MTSKPVPLWARALVEPEWRGLLDEPAFMAELVAAIEEERADFLYPDDFLVIRNWPVEAHAALLQRHPDLSAAFDLAASFPATYVEGEGWDFCREARGLRLYRLRGVEGPAGTDWSQLTPHGSPVPCGPDADIWMVGRDRTREDEAAK